VLSCRLVSHFDFYFQERSGFSLSRGKDELAIFIYCFPDSCFSIGKGRPLLHYYMREGSTAYMEGVNRTYTFVEAVAKFGALVPQAGLLQAYKRARPAFIGCLEQYFVILNENGPDVTPTRGSNSYPIGARGGFGLGRQIGRGRGRPGLRSQRGRGTPIRGRGRPTIVRGLHDSRKRPSEEAPNSSGTPSKRVPPPASQTIDSIPMDETDSVAVENIFD